MKHRSRLLQFGCLSALEHGTADRDIAGYDVDKHISHIYIFTTCDNKNHNIHILSSVLLFTHVDHCYSWDGFTHA